MIILAKINDFVKAYWSEIVLFIIIILLVLCTFAIGFIVGRNSLKQGVEIGLAKNEFI